MQYLNAYYGNDLPEAAIEAVAHTSDGVAAVHKHMGANAKTSEAESHRLEEAVEIRDLLLQNTDELTAVLAALNGEFVLPVPTARKPCILKIARRVKTSAWRVTECMGFSSTSERRYSSIRTRAEA